MQSEFKTRSLSSQLLLKAFRGAVMVGKPALEYRLVYTLSAPRGSRQGALGGRGSGGCLPTYILIPLPPIGKERRGLLRTKKIIKKNASGRNYRRREVLSRGGEVI